MTPREPASQPRVTFGMIVFNGMPYLKHNLLNLYRYAHEIIVVEGASEHASSRASASGHSTDGTLAYLQEFKSAEDPARKLTIITAEDEGHADGIWPGEKSEQSQAYAVRATGDWLWQVDVDEFYDPEDVERLLGLLQDHPQATCVTLPFLNFWGGFSTLVEGGFFWSHLSTGERRGEVRRIFQWRQGYHYATHRPPTIFDSRGHDVTRSRMLSARHVFGPNRGVFHYFMLGGATIHRKAESYARLDATRFAGRTAYCDKLLNALTWRHALRIFDQSGTFNWLRIYQGDHPLCALALNADLKLLGEEEAPMPSSRFRALFRDPRYLLARSCLACFEAIRARLRDVLFELRLKASQFVRTFPPALVRWLPAKLVKHQDEWVHLQPWERASADRRYHQTKERQSRARTGCLQRSQASGFIEHKR